MSAEFAKTVEANNGTVFVQVFNLETGERVDYEWFGCPWHSLEKRLQRAHAWADARMVLLAKYTISDPRRMAR